MSRIDLKKHKGTIFLFVMALAIGLCPVIIGHVVSLPILNEWTNENDWIGFWGGYIGSILGGLITLYVLNETLVNDKEKEKRKEKIDFFDNVVRIYSEMYASIGKMLALSTRVMGLKENELYRQYLLELNKIAGLSMQLDILMKSREGVYEFHAFREMWGNIAEQMNTYTNEFDNELKKGFSDSAKNKNLDKMGDSILENLINLSNIMCECVERNLNKKM